MWTCLVQFGNSLCNRKVQKLRIYKGNFQPKIWDGIPPLFIIQVYLQLFMPKLGIKINNTCHKFTLYSWKQFRIGFVVI